MTQRVPVVENILSANDRLADENRARLDSAGVFAVNLMASPGAGKTSLIEQTLPRLADHARVAVIDGDIATSLDADRAAAAGAKAAIQVNTGGECHLDAVMVHGALNQLDLTQFDLLIIENVGNLICPVGFDLGQDVKVGMFAVSDGDDKAAKHPYIVIEAGLLLLSKVDLLPYVPFDLELFRTDIRRLNPNVPVVECSVITGQGLEGWLNWLRAKVKR